MFFFTCIQLKHLFYLFLLPLDRFFETEGIAVLTMLVSQYKITIKEEPQFAGETFEERKSRILSVRAGLTLTYVIFISIFTSGLMISDPLLLRPVRVPLTLTRR